MKPEPQISRNSLRGRPANSAASGPGNRLFLLLTSNQWLLAVAVGAMAALVFWPYYRYISPWIGGAVFVMGITIVHLRYACRFIIPFPHIALLMTLLQYVLAAWLSSQYPHSDPTYNIGLRLPVYLEYATLVVLACAVGWGLGLAKLRPPARALVRPTVELLQSLDGFILLGFVGVGLSRLIHVPSLNFVFVLLANLRYVGVFGRMLCKGPGWVWRIALILMIEVLFAASSTMFHNLILWSLWTFALWMFVYTPSWRVVLPALVAAMLLLLPLQQSKWQLRRYLGVEESSIGELGVSALDKTGVWLSFLAESMGNTVQGSLDEEFIGDTVVRYNQGWIINRVMQFVPEVEPYARGETIKAAFMSALLPRFLVPGKVLAGGQLYMEKYAGMRLNENTSMNLGYAGEMYANFGYWGGIIGCSLYALAFGLLFRVVCIRAFASPLWWAIMPYIGFSALKAEDGIAEVLNWTVKAAVVMGAVCFAFPAFRRELFHPTQPQSPVPASRIRRRGRVRREKVVNAES